jgi:hypothetical protein
VRANARSSNIFVVLAGLEQPSTAVRDGDLRRKCRKPMAPDFRIACVRSGMESRLIWGWVGA